jgi:acetaldehyde dehydrogenase
MTPSSAGKARAAIIGPGNIGTDLLAKLRRSDSIEVQYVVGVVESDGLQRARSMGIEASAEGLDWLLARDELPQIVFDATSAKAHRAAAPRLEEAGIVAVDLTPAAVGPMVCPPVNFGEHVDAVNINMISCGAQATVPIVHAVSTAAEPFGGVAYAEIVASVASRSAGPGTRANIDEFTRTTAAGVETIGGAERGKAIIILNPAEPPMIMRDTIFCAVPPDADRDAVVQSIVAMEKAVQEYVPGYRLLQEPQLDDPSPATLGQTKVSIFVEVEGAGDYLPQYSGNLDIMTAAAVEVGESIARNLGGWGGRTAPASTSRTGRHPT